MENPYLSMLWSALLPALPYLVFLAAFVFALKVLEAKFMPKKRRWRRSSRRDKGERGKVYPFRPKHDALPDQVPDAADQLRTVMSAEFKAQPLLNKSETKLFMALEKMVAEMTPGWRLMAQVSLGEVLQSRDVAAYRCINSKRVDMLLVDAECRPLHAIEYQGGAHHKGTAAARDAVKKEALRRAGIGYVEVVAGDHTPAELRRIVEKLVQRAIA
jgi:Protein of unknown function (DUF2726)